MKPLVYLLEDDVDSILQKNNNTDNFHKGIALSQDQDSVFHVFWKAPNFPIAGKQYDCFFKFIPKFIPDSEIKENVANYLASSYKRGKNTKSIFIFLKIDSNNKVICKSYFYSTGNLTNCDAKYIPKNNDLYSRSKGLIETDILKNKSVAIIGLGSGGSSIAIELAKSGVGKFILFDFDKLELSNISRHLCGINDLGRYKTYAVRDCILQKNPSAAISTYEININDSLEKFSEAVKEVDLIICASDTNSSRFNINQVSLNHRIVSLYGRVITRGAGGDVLRVRPYEGPCLNCLFSTGLISKEEEISQLRQVRSEMPAYISDNEAIEMIQVGLSSDILPITNMLTKLALIELSRGAISGISSLEEDLIADFYLWANRRERIYQNWPKMEYSFNKQSILRWYGAKIKRDENCIVCSASIKESDNENIFSSEA